MARRPIDLKTLMTEPRGSVAGLDFEDFMGAAPKRSKKRGVGERMTRGAFEKQLAKTRALMKAEAWDQFKPKDFVFLFAHLHEHVYGALPLEVAETPNLAYLAAGRQLRNEFSGNVDRFLEFIRWTWRREKLAHPKRTSDFRIGWRYQFSAASLMTDYRVYLSKKKQPAPR